MKYYKVINPRHYVHNFLVMNELWTEKELLNFARKEYKKPCDYRKFFNRLKRELLPVEVKKTNIIGCFGARFINLPARKVVNVLTSQVNELERLYNNEIKIIYYDNRFFLKRKNTVIASIHKDYGIVKRYIKDKSDINDDVLNCFKSFTELFFNNKVKKYVKAGGGNKFLTVDFEYEIH